MIELINQKEYLKKYHDTGKAPDEKKEKKKKPTANRIQIIDDADVTFTKDEDAPQIVAIIDERPPSLRVDEKTKNPLWQPIGKVEDFNESQQKEMIKCIKIQKPGDKPLASYDRSPPRRKRRVEDINDQRAKKLFRSQQSKLFKSVPEALSGENSKTVHRDRHTGRIRNLEEEQERERKEREEEDKNKENYERWGRGLAQVETYTQKLQEINKPLVRYADDEDLEKYLKEEEHEGDPMLAYMRKKRKAKAAEAGEKTKFQFEGKVMANRYGIRPGHRWDGVNRSGGYEKKWFEVQNEKRAILQDSYKWSTEDM